MPPPVDYSGRASQLVPTSGTGLDAAETAQPHLVVELVRSAASSILFVIRGYPLRVKTGAGISMTRSIS